jgi:AmmeMemoRadiSam system protein B
MQKDKQFNSLGVVSPHAGYIFSGKIAAKAIKTNRRNKRIRKYFRYCLSHRKFEGAAVYNIGDYEMPGF